MKNQDKLKEIYNIFKSNKEKYGAFKKKCLHLHTPESYDYKLLNQWSSNHYKKCSELELYRLCVERIVFTDNVSLDSFNENIIDGFASKKEFFAFLLLANEIIKNELNMVVVTDHNTIKGVSKLQKAIQYIMEYKYSKVHPEVILGIEISCADKNHVVGIFDNNKNNINRINEWLEESLFSTQEGTYKSSLETIEFIKTLNGIGYIAHIDSSDIFKKDMLTGAYKTKLFSSVQLVGVENIENSDKILNLIKNFSASDIKFLVDNDSHSIDDITDRNIWFKGSKNNFKTIKESILDYDICVSFTENEFNRQYIEGLYVEPTKKGYLMDKKTNSGFLIKFSNELNCLIGGRGTGKSTVLEIIEYVLSQYCKSESTLDFICLNGNTWILYNYHGEEYLIRMALPFKGNYDRILECFGQNINHNYRYYYHFDKTEIKEFAFKHHLSIYKVRNEKNNPKFKLDYDKKILMEAFFDRHYSINELVNTASTNNINAFIYETMFSNKILSSADKIIRARSVNGIKKVLPKVKMVLEERKQEVINVIEPFNLKNDGIFKIIYTQDGTVEIPRISDWIIFKDNKGKWLIVDKVKYNLSINQSIEYLESLCCQLDVFNFLDMILNMDVNLALKTVSISDFCTDLTQNLIDKGVESIDKKDESKIVKFLFSKILESNCVNQIISYLKSYVDKIEKFSLQFNICNHESVQKSKAIYKDIKQLSLGQKVVAMLSFILSYCDYSKDYRPLIIDQPEDNLDNQYIYKTLVKTLREEKSKRQVIIATHNATLVTNTKAELVCVMQSDGKNGWIEAIGYSGEKNIKKRIVNYLEGGVDSFNHKIKIYEEVLD